MTGPLSLGPQPAGRVGSPGQKESGAGWFRVDHLLILTPLPGFCLFLALVAWDIRGSKFPHCKGEDSRPARVAGSGDAQTMWIQAAARRRGLEAALRISKQLGLQPEVSHVAPGGPAPGRSSCTWVTAPRLIPRSLLAASPRVTRGHSAEGLRTVAGLPCLCGMSLSAPAGSQLLICTQGTDGGRKEGRQSPPSLSRA